jgi:anti-sigma factor RsiW
MSDCPYIHRIDAYHDGAMGRSEADRMADHVLTCPACAERLRQLHAIGDAIASFPSDPLPALAKARLRRAVADAVDRGPARFAWELTGLAASVLVAASIWLATLPATASAEADAGGNWERAAATGGQSLTALSDARATTADARFANWVVSGLADDTASQQQGARP